MRLSCPNCAAVYEVPDEVIPETGRDVQCSNCGDTWFQVHPDHPDYAQAFDPDAPEDALEDAAEDAAAFAEVAREPEQEAEPEYETEDKAEDERPISTPPPPLPAAPQRNDLPDDVTSVLREEADRESRAREADAGGLETQPDLGLSEDGDVERRTAQAKARMARLRGFDEAQEDPVSDLVQQPDHEASEIELGSRANLLPEVAEVDQNIEAQSEGAAEAQSARDGSRVATQKPAGGFGRGFKYAVALFILATALYIFAPQFGGMVPALDAPLMQYTELVDQARAGLQGLIRE